MRDLKFRAWHKEYKEMTQPFDLHNNQRLEGSHLDVHNYGDGWGWEEWNFWYLEDCILMQSTGLKDKNGKEIYEGDILLNDKDSECMPDQSFVVKWLPGHFVAGGILGAGDHIGEDCKVIGNIHSDPELLNND